MRKPSRINPEFLTSQTARRQATEDTPSNQNSVPALKDRVNNLEELLAVKSYTVA